MYYYIIDPPQTNTDKTLVNTIRSRLIPEGIAGEFIYRTPGQSSALLADRAVKQGFSTIVCIGNDQLASEIASALYDQPTALGIIPIHASPALHNMIGYNDWRIAIQALRHRKLSLHDIAVINGETAFMTEVVVKAPPKSEISLHMNLYTASAPSDHLILTLSGENPPFNVPGVINFTMIGKQSGSAISRLFSNPQLPLIESLFRAEQAVVQCTNQASVMYDGQLIAHTPFSVSIIPQAIRIVVARQAHTNLEDFRE